MKSFWVVSRTADDTGRIAAGLARWLVPGDAVLLTGDLATGKTTFVKAVVEALGSSDLVTSPTFALAQFYSAPTMPILHIDMYRMSGIDEYRDLGLDEFTETSINLIEWGEKVGPEFPCRLVIDFELSGDDKDQRIVTFSSTCERWSAVMSSIHDEVLRVLT